MQTTPSTCRREHPNPRPRACRNARRIAGAVFVTVIALGISASQAEVLRLSQLVNLPSGQLGDTATGTGTAEGWTFPTPEVTVTSGSSSLDGVALGLVASAGDKADMSATAIANLGCRNQFVPNGTFPQTVEANIYYSFLYRFNNADDVDTAGEKILQVNRANSGVATGIHWELQVINVGGQIQIGISKALGSTTNYAPVNISTGQTVFIVVRQQIIPGAANDVYDLWINPPPTSFGADEASLPPASASTSDGTEDASSTGPGRFWVGSGANASFDEFRVTTTWAEVTPPAGQCSSATITTEPADQAVVAGITATFKVTADGTNPSYQWQVSTNGGGSWEDLPGALTASYTTANTTLADEGTRYRVVVTVSCNASTATSAAAVLTVQAPVQTPVGLVVHDPFEDPDLGVNLRDNTPVTISNSVWRTASSANLDAQTGDLVAIPLPGSSSLWLAYFTEDPAVPVHLAVGNAIRVTLPFTLSGNIVATDVGSSLRFGLFDYADGGTRLTGDSSAAGGSAGNGTGVRGYLVTVGFSTTLFDESPLQIYARTVLEDINLMGTTADYLSLGSGPTGLETNTPSFRSDIPYTLELMVTRVADNMVDVSAAITGGGLAWAFSVTDTNLAYRRFDAFAIRPNSLETTADQFTFPEFKVEVLQAVIPPPPFDITGIHVRPDRAVELTWESVSGVSYQVQSCDLLGSGSWAEVATVLATGTSTTYTDSATPPGATSRYYRVVANPPP